MSRRMQKLMIVVAIIGIQAAAAMPNILNRQDRARMAAAVAQASSAREALAAAVSNRDNPLFPLTADIANDATKLNPYGANFTASTFKRITYISAAGKSYKLTVESIDGKKLCVTPEGIDRRGPCT